MTTNTRILTLIALLSLPAIAYGAQEARKARPVACEDFALAKSENATFAICAPSKAGGKPSMLRSYAVATVTDPATGLAVKVAVGFR